MQETKPSAPAQKRESLRLVGGVLMWLLVFELIVRALWQPAVIGENLRSRIDPSFGYGYDATSSLCAPSGDQIVCSPTQYRRIERQAFSRAKSAETVRFITLGGSHSAAPGAYSSFAAEVLAGECPRLSWEGINLSVRGNGSLRTLLLAKRALRLSPDFLVVDFGGTNEFEDERDMSQYRQLHRGIWRFLFKSQFVALGRKLLTRRFAAEISILEAPQEEIIANAVAENHQRWNGSLDRNYRTLIRLAQRVGVPVIFVGRGLLEGHQDVHSQSRERIFRNLPVERAHHLDTETLFDKLASEHAGRLALFAEDRNHYSEEGHRRIAEQLTEIVLEDEAIMKQRSCQ